MVMTCDTGYQPPRMPKYSPKRYSLGVDLGQASDFTAIAVLEKTIVPPETALFSPTGERPGNRLVEGTTVGRGICDMLDSELKRRGTTTKGMPKVDFRRVSVTGSNTTLKRPDRSNGYWSVPKRDLIFPAVAAFQQGKIRIARGIADREALVNELKNYSRKTNIASGNTAFEPWRESDHDDLLFAVCLALWGWQTRKPRATLRVIR